MYIVMVSSECAPVAKVGGLGDVVLGLSRELEIRGNAVEIILPKYDCMRYDHVWGMQVAYENLWVPWFNYSIRCTVWFGYVHGRKIFFIEPHSDDNFFNRGSYYGFADEHMRFAFFSRAALEFMLKTGKRPDIIHTHDWQTALVPVMLYELYKFLGMENCRVCHTIHNFKHQGIAGENVLWFTGLGRPEYYFDKDRMGDDFNPTAINFMKGAVVYSNFITTVSPTHAWEVRHSAWGYGLGHILHVHQNKFSGVLNGLDYEMWNPSTDPYISQHYDVGNIAQKYANKDALRKRLWLRDDYKPLIAYVGRLDPQKGVPLIRHALYYALSRGCQFVLLGSSTEMGINAEFWQLKHELNEIPDCHLEIGYDEELAHMIYAGSDMLVVPSMYEPCGLTQMIAFRYGTVPIVRAVGGLADTVFDRDYSAAPEEQRNGYVFHQTDPHAIESAMDRAIGLWYTYPDEFRRLIENGMKYDYSWNNPGQNYLNIYDYIRHH
ncbi:MAG: glycogen synthase GlgA [Thiogranum sp.]|jgi:starch synthase